MIEVCVAKSYTLWLQLNDNNNNNNNNNNKNKKQAIGKFNENVFSTYNCNRRPEQCSSMGKKSLFSTRIVPNLPLAGMSIVLSYADGGTKNKHLIELAKEIWKYPHNLGITATAEYLPSSRNVEAVWQSRN